LPANWILRDRGAAPDFAAQQNNRHERTLIENLRECIDWLVKLDPADRDDIRGVLKTIVRGQNSTSGVLAIRRP
jgi:hypothetical protein